VTATTAEALHQPFSGTSPLANVLAAVIASSAQDSGTTCPGPPAITREAP
jgi:hypothetical protein